MKVYVVTAWNSSTYEEWVVEVHDNLISAQEVVQAQKELMRKTWGNIQYNLDEVDFIQTPGK